ncbi:MAG TPA: hypothetical protein VHN74_07020 [Candidatus Angelobacter sp.]|jgi:hypothetical protein|nr:hypothetical protein [Candidatus Angelobacter sp.]
MKKIALTLLAVACLATLSLAKDDAKAKKESISGWVSDAKCAAKGNSAEHAACAKKCAEAGEKLVVVNDKDNSVVQIHNQDALKGHEGHHVKVTGSQTADGFHVDKVAMVKDQGKKEEKAEKKGM